MEIDDELLDLWGRQGITWSRVPRRVPWRHPWRYHIETSSREQVRLVWNLLDRDLCFIEETKVASWNRRTTWPTSYLYRFLHDHGTRWGANPLALFPVMMPLFLAFSYRVNAAAAGVATVVLAVGWWLVMRRLSQDEPGGFDTKGMMHRFVLGAIVGTSLVLLARGTFSFDEVFFALLTFMMANGVWIWTVGYDRFLFETELDRAGRRSESEVWHLLCGIAD